MLSHICIGKSLDDIKRFVKDSYEMRSSYVHRGGRGKLAEPASSIELVDRMKRLTDVVRSILGAACFARREDWAQVPDARKVWMARVDLLTAKVRAGINLSSEDLRSLGLDQVRLRPGEVSRVAIV
jgi:hypothetical protein